MEESMVVWEYGSMGVNRGSVLLFYFMISFIYKKLTPFTLLVSFLACSKDSSSDPATLLMNKAWSPYQVEIRMIDSIRVVVTIRSTGENISETKSVSNSDTTWLVEACQSKSVYQFKANGVQILTDECFSNSTDYQCTWSITQTSQMFFSQFVTGLVPVTGLLSSIKPSKFIFNTVGINYALETSIDANGNLISTYHTLNTTRILTFRSR